MLDFKYPPENMLNENMKFILISLTHMKKKCFVDGRREMKETSS